MVCWLIWWLVGMVGWCGLFVGGVGCCVFCFMGVCSLMVGCGVMMDFGSVIEILLYVWNGEIKKNSGW